MAFAFEKLILFDSWGKLCEINKVLGPLGPFCIWGNWGSEKFLKVCSAEEWKIENRSSESRLDLFGVPWCHSGGERLLLQIGSLKVLAKPFNLSWKIRKFYPCIFHPSKERTSGFFLKHILTSDNTSLYSIKVSLLHQTGYGPHPYAQVADLSYQLWAKKALSCSLCWIWQRPGMWVHCPGNIILALVFKIIFSFFPCLNFSALKESW